MEVHRHSRHRSRAHSFISGEKKSQAKAKRGDKGRHSKKPRIYRDIDRNWKRNKFDEE